MPAALLSLFFLGITLSLLVYKLERPERFMWVMTRPQWRSWLTRGAYTMTVYSMLLMLVISHPVHPEAGPRMDCSVLTAVMGAGRWRFIALSYSIKPRDGTFGKAPCCLSIVWLMPLWPVRPC